MNPTETTIFAFGEDHVSRLTGLSVGQLRAWDRRGFFTPHYAYEDRRAPYSRVYSFQDVVGLRTIAVLKQRHRISLAELERTAAKLQARGYKHWADVKLYVVKRQVHFQVPDSATAEGLDDGQYVMVPIIDVIHDVEDRVAELRQRPRSTVGQVGRSRHVLRNAPVVKGTRIPTGAIRRFHEDGYTTEQILKEYPSLSSADVEAALAYENEHGNERLARSA